MVTTITYMNVNFKCIFVYKNSITRPKLKMILFLIVRVRLTMFTVVLGAAQKDEPRRTLTGKFIFVIFIFNNFVDLKSEYI